MLPARLLIGVPPAAAVIGAFRLYDVPMSPIAITTTVALLALPPLVWSIWRAGNPATGPAAPEAPTENVVESFETLNVALLGRGERPFAFESIAEARRAGRRAHPDHGLVACDGYYFLTDRRTSDRDLVRAYIRSAYALVPGQPGKPVIHVAGRSPRPVAAVPSSRVLDTRAAMRRAMLSSDPIERLTRDLVTPSRGGLEAA